MTDNKFRKIIEKYMEAAKISRANGEDKPIFEIMVFQHPDKELVYPNGVHAGFPDLGSSATMGFYHELDDAIEAFHKNYCDIYEAGLYKAGFVLCRYPGLYDSVGKNGRIYFLWDEDKGGFFEKEEPEIFEHIAY